MAIKYHDTTMGTDLSVVLVSSGDSGGDGSELQVTGF